MDTTSREDLGRFWAAAGGLQFQPDEEAGQLVGSTEGHGIAMCLVPEPRTVKHRVHLDVYGSSVDELTAWGASVAAPAEDTGLPWTRMADPEGGEFCFFPRERHRENWATLQADRVPGLPEYRIHGVVVDSADPPVIARWWHDVLGGELGAHVDGEPEQGMWLSDVPGLPILSMDFAPVPEPKTVKNRIHWDVYGDTEQLLGRGATLLRAQDDEIGWDVLADPEGNEFCVFTPTR